jgi:DNA-binding NarL/FixJ family response regulator
MWPDRNDHGIVLVVDDNPETLRMLIDALEASGLTALVARDAAAAMALLDRVQPDAVLLDAVMPGVDGFELCRRIKARPEHATRPVLFMTGLSDSANIVQGLRAGGVDYLVKPLNPDELIARVSIHVANARLIAASQSALDATGAAILAFRPDGAVLWASPRAQRILDDEAGPVEALPEKQRAALVHWVGSIAEASVRESGSFLIHDDTGPRLELRLIGRSGRGDLLTHLKVASEGDPARLLADHLGLSTREGEVLHWISKGKSNRDIATIMNISARTITKHVEQIFKKMSVENRTSAAISAIKILQEMKD